MTMITMMMMMNLWLMTTMTMITIDDDDDDEDVTLKMTVITKSPYNDLACRLAEWVAFLHAVVIATVVMCRVSQPSLHRQGAPWGRGVINNIDNYVINNYQYLGYKLWRNCNPFTTDDDDGGITKSSNSNSWRIIVTKTWRWRLLISRWRRWRCRCW